MARIEDIISIPFAAKAIASHTNRRQLAKWMRVSQAFHQAFTPSLWQTIERYRVERFPRPRRKPLLNEAIHKYGRYIHHIVFDDPQDLFPIKSCTNLRSLSVVTDRMKDNHWPALVRLAKANRRLEKVEVYVEHPNLQAVANFFANLNPQSIQTISITYVGAPFYGDLVHTIFSVLKDSTTLRSLVVDKDHRGLIDQWIECDAGYPVPPGTVFCVPKSLRTVSLFEGNWMNHNHYYRALVTAVVEQCLHLEQVTLPWVENPQVLATAIRSHQSQQSIFAKSLQRIRFCHTMPFEEESMVATVLEACAPNSLKELKFDGGYGGQRGIELILNHTESLEVLDMEGNRAQSNNIQAILSSCSRLKTYYAGGPTFNFGVLRGEDALRSAWIAKDLVRLQLPLGGFCSTMNRNQCRRHAQCRMRERQLLAKIGQLVQLRVLDVSHERDDYHFQERMPHNLWIANCSLEWSLAAGLDELIRLRHLVIFQCKGVKHAMGAPEKDWIRRHWRKLRYCTVFGTGFEDFDEMLLHVK